MSLIYKYPSNYNFFKLKNVNLPGTSTIRRWHGMSKFLPGFSKILLNHLQKKFEFKTIKEKKCTLCFDEISIKECLEYSNNLISLKDLEILDIWVEQIM